MADKVTYEKGANDRSLRPRKSRTAPEGTNTTTMIEQKDKTDCANIKEKKAKAVCVINEVITEEGVTHHESAQDLNHPLDFVEGKDSLEIILMTRTDTTAEEVEDPTM